MNHITSHYITFFCSASDVDENWLNVSEIFLNHVACLGGSVAFHWRMTGNVNYTEINWKMQRAGDPTDVQQPVCSRVFGAPEMECQNDWFGRVSTVKNSPTSGINITDLKATDAGVYFINVQYVKKSSGLDNSSATDEFANVVRKTTLEIFNSNIN